MIGVFEYYLNIWVFKHFSTLQTCYIFSVYICVVCVSWCRYFTAQSALDRQREPADMDSDADEVDDDEFDTFLGKFLFTVMH